MLIVDGHHTLAVGKGSDEPTCKAFFTHRYLGGKVEDEGGTEVFYMALAKQTCFEIMGTRNLESIYSHLIQL